MSERAAFRGGRGGGRGGERGRGGGRGGAQGGAGQTERPKKENILDLSKYMDKQVNVKFSGGREGKLSIDDPGGKRGTPVGGVERKQVRKERCTNTALSYWHA
jgi:hypothetical protein